MVYNRIMVQSEIVGRAVSSGGGSLSGCCQSFHVIQLHHCRRCRHRSRNLAMAVAGYKHKLLHPLRGWGTGLGQQPIPIQIISQCFQIPNYRKDRGLEDNIAPSQTLFCHCRWLSTQPESKNWYLDVMAVVADNAGHYLTSIFLLFRLAIFNFQYWNIWVAGECNIRRTTCL